MRAVKWLSRERCLSHLVPVVAGEEPLPPQQKKKKEGTGNGRTDRKERSSCFRLRGVV